MVVPTDEDIAPPKFNYDEPMTDNYERNKMETQNQVTKKEVHLPSTDMAQWGKREIRTTSIVIPRIRKMEFQSDKVKAQTAKFGEFRDSLTDRVYGDLEHPFQVVPVYVEEKWAIYDLIKTKGKVTREFKEMVPLTSENENWKYKTETQENDRIMDVYCLIPDEIELLPEDWKQRGLKPLPKILSFRGSSSGKAGKKLYTQMYIINESKGLPPCATIIEVSGKSKEGPNESTYVSVDVKPVRNATNREGEIALLWFKAITSGQTKADETDLTKHESVEATTDEAIDY